jgi:DNA-binding NarL/FixJ family response regulator
LPPPVLREPEREALDHLSEGLPIELTSAALSLTVTGVQQLRANAVLKLQRHARTEAVMYTVADRVFGF